MLEPSLCCAYLKRKIKHPSILRKEGNKPSNKKEKERDRREHVDVRLDRCQWQRQCFSSPFLSSFHLSLDCWNIIRKKKESASFKKREKYMNKSLNIMASYEFIRLMYCIALDVSGRKKKKKNLTKGERRSDIDIWKINHLGREKKK